MSHYLAIDTATDVASVAIGSGSATAVEIILPDRRHGTALAPAIVDALRLAALSADDLDGVIVADGPGSFTGLRIGLATAKGLLQSHDHLECWVAPSLLGAAWVASGLTSGAVAAVYDALRGEVFAAVYRFHRTRVETLVAPRLTTPEGLAELCPERPALAVGNGALQHVDWARRWTGSSPVDARLVIPRSSGMLALRTVAGALREVTDLERFEPTYGRLAEAQVRWEKRHGTPLRGSEG